METKNTAETTAPSVARAKPAPKFTPAGDPDREDPIPSVPLSGPKNNLTDLSGLEVTFSGLRVGSLEGKRKRQKKRG